MGKIIMITTTMAIVAVVLLSVLSACGNQAILDPGNFTFKHVNITNYIESHCFNIKKWWENDGTGIEVKTDSGEGIFCSEGTYQLFESASMCPYCK